MKLMEEVRREYKRQVDEHYDENRAAALNIGELLEASPLNYNGVFDKTVHIPKVYDQETIDRFQEIAGITYRIFSKTIDEYQNNPAFRALFPFSKELEELILLPIPYESRLPIARFDLFYYEDTGDFKFCEINTDGTAAMVRDLEYRKVLDRNPAHMAVSAMYDLEPFEVFEAPPGMQRTVRQLGRRIPAHLRHLCKKGRPPECGDRRHHGQRDDRRL